MTGRKKIVFRSDGNSEIGLGHIYRSLALLDMLKGVFDCHFVTNSPQNIVNLIQRHTLNVSDISKAAHPFEFFLSGLSGDEIVVLDNYFFTSEYQRQIKEKGCKLVCIDDIPQIHFYADVIINHSPGAQPEEYSSEPYAQKLFGLDYVLLRSAFLENKGLVRKSGIPDKYVAFVCFGGADPENLTLKAINQLLKCSNVERVHAVMGKAFSEPNFRALEEVNHPKVKLFRDVEEDSLITLIKGADFGIVPTSGILLECLALKLPVISGYYVENQKGISRYFEDKKIGKIVGDLFNLNITESLVTYVMELPFDPTLIDGRSGERLLNEFTKLANEA